MAESSRKEWDYVVESHLGEHGPTPRHVLSYGSVRGALDRGVEVFSPYNGPASMKPSVGVVYLPCHDPEAVMRVWVDANTEGLNELSRSSVTRRIGELYDETWVRAWKRCAEEAGIEAHQEAPENPDRDPKRQCPECGERIRARRFVKHLTECG